MDARFPWEAEGLGRISICLAIQQYEEMLRPSKRRYEKLMRDRPRHVMGQQGEDPAYRLCVVSVLLDRLQLERSFADSLARCCMDVRHRWYRGELPISLAKSLEALQAEQQKLLTEQRDLIVRAVHHARTTLV